MSPNNNPSTLTLKSFRVLRAPVRVKFGLFLTIIFLFISTIAFSQVAADIDTLLESNIISTEMAAYFILGAAGLLPEEISVKSAYDNAKSRGWIKSADCCEAVTLQDTAFLIMNAFDLKGGIMYTLLKSPRYAYRELQYKRIIQGRSDPKMTISGNRLLYILDLIIIYSGMNRQYEDMIYADTDNEIFWRQ